MLFSDGLLASCSRNYVLGQFVRRSCWPPPLESVPTLLDGTLAYRVKYIVLKKSVYSVPGE